MSGIAYAKGDIFDPVISIKYNSNSQANNLKQFSNYRPHKTLGTFKAPAGVDQEGGKIMLEKNEVHMKTIINSPFDRKDTWTYYHSIYLPSITYPFPSTNIQNKTIQKMQKQIKSAILPNYGFNRNTPTAVVCSSADFAGIEM